MSITPSVMGFGESTYWGITAQKIAQTMPYRLATYVAGTSAENRAVTGMTIGEQIASGCLSPARIVRYRNPLAIVNFCINDAWYGTDVETFKSRLATVVDTIRRAGKLVILQTPNTITVEQYFDGTAIKDALTPAQRLSAIAGKVIEVANQYVLPRDGVGARNLGQSGMSDAIHPSDSGYDASLASLRIQATDQRILDANFRVQAALMYVACLCRAPEKAGLDYWAGELAAGRSAFDNGSLATGILLSAEGQTQYPLSLTNTQFVTAAYTKFLGRQPDTAGLNYWVGKLNGGQSRPLMMTELISDTYNYAQVGGTIESGLASQRLAVNRLSVSLAYGWIFGKTAQTGSFLPGGPFASITDDPATVHPVTNTF